MTTAHIGQPVNRVDGRLKVTGQAKYAAEHTVPGLLHGAVVSAAIAKGRIARIDTGEALRVPGVLQVFTHENSPRLARLDRSWRDSIAPPGSPFRPLHDDMIRYSAQPIALVVADTIEAARLAASLVTVEYERAEHATNVEEHFEEARKPKKRLGIDQAASRGNADAAYAKAEVRLEAEYRVPAEHHNPMEPFATTVLRDDDGKLTIYDKTQGVQNVQGYLRKVFGGSANELRVLSPFVGGAFGSGLRPQYQVFLAVLAARELKRSVRVALTRQQMFSFGYRPATWQRVSLGATADGRLQAILHDVVGVTSRFEDFSEAVANWSGVLYQCDDVDLDYKLVPLDLHTPIDMRAPGAAWGVYALECAMDELAVKLSMDPVELRLRNYADKDQAEDKPFSSKELRACYEQGAQRFGWERRNPQPRSMQQGHELIGWGMATGIWEASQLFATAKAVLSADGKLTVSSATADIGTGTYTIMTQIAAELLGLPMEHVTFKLGDSALSQAPVEGGSFTASTVGSAVQGVCEKLQQQLFELAIKGKESPLAGAKFADVVFEDRHIRLKDDRQRAVSLIEAMRAAGMNALEESKTALPNVVKQSGVSRYSHSAVFAEVAVDQDLGAIRVTRVVSAIAGGRILNPKTARSQILGGIVWGIGMALHEESLMDHAFGRFMNHNLAEYHIPVNADVRDIEVLFVEEHDEHVNPLGAKGLGELGVVGVAAAIANAIFHATGKRLRDLPITLDKLL